MRGNVKLVARGLSSGGRSQTDGSRGPNNDLPDQRQDEPGMTQSPSAICESSVLVYCVVIGPSSSFLLICYLLIVLGGAVVQRVRHLGLRSVGRGFKSCSRQRCVTTLGKLFIPMCLCHQAV